MEIRDLLGTIKNEQQKEAALKLFDSVENTMLSMPAAIRHHHPDKGGLYRHTREVMLLAISIYRASKNDFLKKLIFEDDVILVAFVHDLEKTIKYKFNKNYDESKKWEKGYKETEFNYNYDKIDTNDTAYVVKMCYEHGIKLTDNHLNAITMHHGGWSVDSKNKMTPLACILHSADLISTYLYG
jgi:23S rRNA maturation-related 3'-5' exoribonuclease YhaM